MAKQILICGDELTLLETRKFILTKAGYDVLVCDGQKATEKLKHVMGLDLFILCSSLSVDEQLYLLKCSHQAQPGLKNLYLVTGSQINVADAHRAATISETDTSFKALEGPERFLERVNLLLAS